MLTDGPVGSTENALFHGISAIMGTVDAHWKVSLYRNDRVEIGVKIASLSTLLDEAGVQATVSDPDRISDVFDLAKRIGGLVYVGFADSVIYASALVAGADYLITFDDYLRKTVNRIRTGPPPYDDIKKRLRTVVGEILLADVASVTLPEAIRRFPPGRQ